MKEQKPFVTVYIVACNEEVIIEFVIKAHRMKFPNCIIHIYDNYSTDRTVEIAKSLGCIIHYFDSDGKHNNKIKKDIQNNVWKTATTDWVWVSDCDEIGGITQDELKYEESLGYNVIKFETWNMMNKTDVINLKEMMYGFRYHSSYSHFTAYDKWWLFNKKYIREINYKEGSHPQGMGPTQLITGVSLKYGSSKVYKAYHYKFISPKYTIEKHNRWRNTRCLKYTGTDSNTGEQYYLSDKTTAHDDAPYGYISTDTNQTKAAYPPDQFYYDIYDNAKLEKVLNESLIN